MRSGAAAPSVVVGALSFRTLKKGCPFWKPLHYTTKGPPDRTPRKKVQVSFVPFFWAPTFCLFLGARSFSFWFSRGLRLTYKQNTFTCFFLPRGVDLFFFRRMSVFFFLQSFLFNSISYSFIFCFY